MTEIDLAELFVARHGAEWRYIDNKNWTRNRAPHGWHHLTEGNWSKDQTLEDLRRHQEIRQ
jgi:hypothetical protein